MLIEVNTGVRGHNEVGESGYFSGSFGTKEKQKTLLMLGGIGDVERVSSNRWMIELYRCAYIQCAERKGNGEMGLGEKTESYCRHCLEGGK